MSGAQYLDAHAMARALGGDAAGNNILCPGPGHSSKDRSLSVTLDPSAPGGFVVNSFCGDDPLACRDYVRQTCGLGDFVAEDQSHKPKPGPGRTSAAKLGAMTDYPPFDGKEFIETEPQPGAHETARWTYRDFAGRKVKIVVKLAGKRFRQVYAVRLEDRVGWQWKKPDGYRDVPYNLSIAMDGERFTEPVFVCEGEKDCDTLTRAGFVAITWGAAGRMPADGIGFLAGRRCIVVGDCDEPGAKHCSTCAGLLVGTASDIRTWIPDGPDGYDVTDWFSDGGDAAALRGMLDKLAPYAADVVVDGSGPLDEKLLTEMSVAEAFIAQYGDHVRFDHTAGKWYTWQGYYWKENETGVVMDWVREFVRAATATHKPVVALTVEKASFARGVEMFSRNHQKVAVTADAWDADPMLMGTPGGTIDLASGTMSAGRPEQMITRLAGCIPSQTADCPRWFDFLDEATDGDRELQHGLQLWAGYSLTGLTTEQTLVFLHGPGGTGKGVFVNTLSRVMHDYAKAADMETFTARAFSAHPEELASLQHARLVSASETEEGRAWAESRVKKLTGGDPIRARFMRQNSYQFRPTFKLTFMGNHMPTLSNLDDAMKRRFRLVPFNTKPSHVDTDLENKLAEELPGIFRWALDGCAEWLRAGLDWPDAVTVATEGYFGDQDVFGSWLEEECRVEPENDYLVTSSRDLFKSWYDYATRNNEPAGTARTFAANMRKRGYEKQQIKAIQTKGYRGIGLKMDQPDARGSLV